MNELMKKAKRLGKHVDTEWAERHEKEYLQFANELSEQYALGNISDDELEELATTAFYDIDIDELKG